MKAMQNAEEIMAGDPSTWIASHIRSLPAYTPIEPFEVLSERLGRTPENIIKLDANENPYGPCAHARKALANLRFPHIYPDPESRDLRAAVSRFTGVGEETLLAGAGVDELIDLLMRVLIEPQDCIISCPPTFGMYAFDAHLNAGQLVEVARRPDFSPDLPAIRQAVEKHRPKILFLATPNNPDGSFPPPEILEELISLPVLVVLDEAYIEFSGEGFLGSGLSRLKQVPQARNLVVLRTFSKWAGLAGLRVGYGAFPDWLMPALWKAKQPYNINVAASAAAIASIEDAANLAEVVGRLASERDRLFEELQKIPFLQPYPSRANFILCKVSDTIKGKASDSAGSVLKAELANQGILVRYFDKPGLRDHIRISAGRPKETDVLLKVLWELSEAKSQEIEMRGRNL
jgi:histidinol-phosphate aminotransferase